MTFLAVRAVKAHNFEIRLSMNKDIYRSYSCSLKLHTITKKRTVDILRIFPISLKNSVRESRIYVIMNRHILELEKNVHYL